MSTTGSEQAKFFATHLTTRRSFCSPNLGLKTINEHSISLANKILYGVVMKNWSMHKCTIKNTQTLSVRPWGWERELKLVKLLTGGLCKIYRFRKKAASKETTYQTSPSSPNSLKFSNSFEYAEAQLESNLCIRYNRSTQSHLFLLIFWSVLGQFKSWPFLDIAFIHNTVLHSCPPSRCRIHFYWNVSPVGLYTWS